MNERGKIWTILLAGGALLGSACGASDGPDQDLAVTGDERVVSFEEFEASVYREPWEGGKYIVDFDIALADEAALRDYYDRYVPAGVDALTVNQIFGTDDIQDYPGRFHLSYCVSNTFGSDKANVVATLADAAASWSDQIGVDYEYVPGEDGNCDANNGDVTFDVRPVSASYFARSFFPSDGRASRNLLITSSAMTTNSGGRDFEGILRHELGHTLGFRHEHIWLSSPCTTETSADARQVTSYDVNSVMHYPQCRPSGTGGYRQTDNDYLGARSLYGTAPALIKAATSALL